MSKRRVGQRAILGLARGAVGAALLALIGGGCWRGEPAPADDPARLTISLRSSAFTDGGTISAGCTCDGAGTSPPLEWSGVPQAARELVLIVEDPDAPMGTFSHWVVVGLPPAVKGLKEAVPAEPVVPVESMVAADDAGREAVARQGKNDFGKIGYGGPCPPSGTHRYVFRLYALDGPTKLESESPARSDVLRAIKGHILAEGRLIGRYARTK